jgi:hypothetical protein
MWRCTLRLILALLLGGSGAALAASPSLPPLQPLALSAPVLDAAQGQHHVRMATLGDGRLVVAYSQGYAAGCGLFDRCRHYPQTWHLVADRSGLVAGPLRSWPELDVKPGINNYSRHPFNAISAGDGQSVLVGLSHSSHNSDGGHYLRIDGTGQVLSRAGGVDAFGAGVCAMRRDTIAFVVWSDPSSAGYAWFGPDDRLRSLVNLGGYRYNFSGTTELNCGYSAALGADFAVIVREVESSHFGVVLYRADKPRWTVIGAEARARWPMKGRPCCGEMVSQGDTGVIFARGVGPDGRRSIFFLRYRITRNGISFVDSEPRPVPLSPDLEGLDSAAVAGGEGRYYVLLFEAGKGRQLLRVLSLDFATATLRDVAQPQEAGGLSLNTPRNYYAESQNEEAFRMALACDGSLYVGGAFDDGKGLGQLRVFSLPVAGGSCRPARTVGGSPARAPGRAP